MNNNNEEQDANVSGIVVLSPSLQVLHMNRRAMVLLNQVEHTKRVVGAERTVAAPLHQHCRDIIETLQSRLESNNWERFQHCRTISASPHSILLKGFGIPDSRGLSYSRIVMLLSPYNPVPIPGMSRNGSWAGISERDYLDVNPPRGISLQQNAEQSISATVRDA